MDVRAGGQVPYVDLLQLGVPIKTSCLGHASITTTMDTYAQLLPAMDRNAADTFAEILRDADEQLVRAAGLR